jgi:hypothetical protein
VRGSGRRLAAVSIALAGSVLTVTGCTGGVFPLGPTPPPPTQLASPIVLEPVVSQPEAAAGGCPAGYSTLPGPGSTPGMCYRQQGKAVTFTSARVSMGPVSTTVQQLVPTQSPAPALSTVATANPQPTGYTLLITLPAAEAAVLTTLTTTAFNSGNGQIAIIVAGQTWGIPTTLAPLSKGQFLIPAPSKNQALHLEHILVPAS